jgi:hypothetical protein
VQGEVLRCEVKGLAGPLVEGELEKALEFAVRFASAGTVPAR